MFNTKLYKDMLRQLRLPGLVFLIVSIVASAIVPIISFVEQQKFLAAESDYAIYPYAPSIAGITPALFVCVFVAGLLLTMLAFSFLNKRSSSDFYHSLPNSRTTTYLSVASAVVTWIALIVIPTVLITSGVYFVLGMGFDVLYTWCLIGVFMASTSLVAAVTTLAMSITGTVLSNLIVCAIVGFVPRVILFVMSVTIGENIPIVSNSTIGLLDTTYNLPVGFLAYIFDVVNGVSIDDVFISGGRMLYTALLALIYFAAAGYFFSVRKSEAADKNAPNKVLQHVYRCGVALPFLLPVALYVVGNGGFNGNMDIISVFTIASILVYFIYELVTTRKLKNLIKAAPFYLIVVAAVVTVGGVSNLIGGSILSKTPTPSEVEYVQFKSRGNNGSFLNAQTSNVKFKEEELKQILCDELKRNVDEVNGVYATYSRSFASQADVTFKLNSGKTFSRRIFLDNINYNKIEAVKQKNVSYMEQLRTIPSYEQVTNVSGLYGLTRKEVDTFLDIYRAEVLELSDDDYFNLMRNGGQSEPGAIRLFEVDSMDGTKRYRDHLTIGKSTPKSVKYYSETLALKKGEAARKAFEIIKLIGEKSSDSQDYSGFTATLWDGRSINAYTRSEEFDIEPKSVTEAELYEIIDMLTTLDYGAIDPSKPYILIDANYGYNRTASDPSASKSDSISMILQLTQEQLDAIGDKMISLS